MAVGAEAENQGSVRNCSAKVKLKEQTQLDWCVGAAIGISHI